MPAKQIISEKIDGNTCLKNLSIIRLHNRLDCNLAAVCQNRLNQQLHIVKTYNQIFDYLHAAAPRHSIQTSKLENKPCKEQSWFSISLTHYSVPTWPSYSELVDCYLLKAKAYIRWRRRGGGEWEIDRGMREGGRGNHTPLPCHKLKQTKLYFTNTIKGEGRISRTYWQQNYFGQTNRLLLLCAGQQLLLWSSSSSYMFNNDIIDT